MGKAVFLDRDGVLINNEHHYYIWKINQVEFVDGIFENLGRLVKQGFQLFIVSNQGGISKGQYSKDDILELHEYLLENFRKNDIEIADIAFCPHHPENEKCLCRKPEPLLIDRLLARYKIDKNESYFVGDRQSDLEAAHKAGIRGIKVDANQNIFPFISFLIK
jgi:D-glycero-D-manno-heptose 1,7-bisphosphate phosphatase